MADTVLIPCWRRSELLWHTLANIKRAEGADQLHYIFRPDVGFSEDVLSVIRTFPFSYEIAPTPKTPYRHLITKQSFSLLSGYQLAANESTGFVFLIEEDIFVAKDFFKWHREVHAQNPNLFCSIAVANHNRTINQEGGHEDYYLTTLDYCSWGVCYRKETILRDVIPMASDRYYSNPQPYVQKTFPGYPLGTRGLEQDGLIRRTQWKLGMERPIAYPYQPRAYHAGIYGYNSKEGPGGTLAKRIQYIADVCYSPEAMRTLAVRPECANDSIPFDLNTPPWQRQQLRPLDLERSPARI